MPLLYFFEGPDGVGKSTVHGEVARVLRDRGRAVLDLAFPGKQPGTLGEVVYRIHHEPGKFGIPQPNPVSLQLLHVAAHIEAIETQVKPALREGKVILLDRFWWSTWVYGVTAGVAAEWMEEVIRPEETAWRETLPEAGFLITAREPHRPEQPRSRFLALSEAYERRAERAPFPVIRVPNDDDVGEAISRVLAEIDESLPNLSP